MRQYKVLKVLGAGGFGVTYLVNDETLDKIFAVKEYFPDDFALRNGTTIKEKSGHSDVFAAAKVSFLDEARILARFHHPNIVKVIQIFEANNTAYMVQEYERGRSLKAWLKEIGDAPTQLELDCVVEPLLNALELIHRNNLLHLDVAPDNIMIRDDGTPVLLDFGSAKDAVAQRTKNIGAIIKPGYSPVELYSSRGRGQGPWSEIYSLAATLYCAVTGRPPQEATERLLTDNLVSTKQAAKGEYRTTFLDAIDWGLRVAPKDRPQSITDWRSALFAEGAPVQVSLGDQSNEPRGKENKVDGAKKKKVSEKSKKTASEQKSSSDVQPIHKGRRADFYVSAAVLLMIVIGIGANWRNKIETTISTWVNSISNGETTIRANETAVFRAAWQSDVKLQAYLDSCKICEYRSETQKQIATLRFQNNERIRISLLETTDYRAARGNATLLRRYLNNCRVCDYRNAVTTEIRRIDEEATYRAAQGNKGLLQAYVNDCRVCAYREAAKNEVVSIEQRERSQFAAQGGPFIPVDFWESNQSKLKSIPYGDGEIRRTLVYMYPSEKMRREGVREGAVFFEGRRIGKRWEGQIYKYFTSCQRTPYPVTGTIAEDDRSVALSGMAPVLDIDCRTRGQEDGRALLVFHDKEDNWGRNP